MRDLEHVRRSSESSEAREVRLQAIRSHHQSTRACTTPVLTPTVSGEEQRRLHQLSKDLEKFRSEIIVSPSNSCFSCHRLTYLQGGSYVTYETVEDLIGTLYSHPTTIPLPDVPEGECVWLCTSILGKGKVPPHARINNIKVPPVLICVKHNGAEVEYTTVPSSSSITTHSCKGYVVRKPKIMRALHWLKTSNIIIVC